MEIHNRKTKYVPNVEAIDFRNEGQAPIGLVSINDINAWIVEDGLRTLQLGSTGRLASNPAIGI